MNSTAKNIDWENKPKLRYKWFSLIFILLGCYFSFLIYTTAKEIYHKHTTELGFKIDAKSVAVGLADLEISPLEPLEINQKKLDLLYNLGLGKVEISYPEEKNSNEESLNQGQQSPTINSDNLGNFYYLNIVFSGDMYEQLYFLSKFDLLRDFVIVDAIVSNQTTIGIDARVYGQ